MYRQHDNIDCMKLDCGGVLRGKNGLRRGPTGLNRSWTFDPCTPCLKICTPTFKILPNTLICVPQKRSQLQSAILTAAGSKIRHWNISFTILAGCPLMGKSSIKLHNHFLINVGPVIIVAMACRLTGCRLHENPKFWHVCHHFVHNLYTATVAPVVVKHDLAIN